MDGYTYYMVTGEILEAEGADAMMDENEKTYTQRELDDAVDEAVSYALSHLEGYELVRKASSPPPPSHSEMRAWRRA